MNFDNLCVVFSYLDYKDLTNCRLVCKLYKNVADREEYWRNLWQHHWDCGEEVFPDQNVNKWRNAFVQKYSQFGKYIAFYKRVKLAWNEIERVMRIYNDNAARYLLPGTTEEELNRFEEENCVSLPLDYRCSMRIHAGEMYRRSDMNDSGPPVLGVVQYYHVNRAEYLLPLRWSPELTSQFPVFPEKTKRHGVIALSMSKRNHLSPAFRTLQLISIDDRKSGLAIGTVFYWVVKPNCDPVYLYHVNDQQPMESYVRNAICDDITANHKMASSYMQWLEQLSMKYKYNAQVSGGRIFDYVYSGYNFNPDWVLTTHHVTVRVGIRFIPEESSMNWFWTYRVIFEMADDAPSSASCTLQRRHWIIRDAQGRVDVVDGEGVIGEYPKLEPGTVWSYSSCTHLSSQSGSMGGFFTFKNYGGDCYRIQCPEFQLSNL